MAPCNGCFRRALPQFQRLLVFDGLGSGQDGEYVLHGAANVDPESGQRNVVFFGPRFYTRDQLGKRLGHPGR